MSDLKIISEKLGKLEDIDQVLCDTSASIGTINTNLSRIAVALEALVAQGKEKKAAPVETKKTAPAKQKKAKEQPEPPTATHADLKAVCLKVAREGKKDAVKAVLKTYDAIKAVDIPVAKIVEVIAKLEEL